MSNIYTFYPTIKNNNYKFDFNQDFHNKINNDYIMHKITIYFEKEIVDLKKNTLFSIGICHEYPDRYLDTYEFINNKISYIIPSFDNDYIGNNKNIITAGYYPENIIKSVDVELKKHDVNIERNIHFNGSGYCIITSSYFKSFNELINYVMVDSGMNYELSKKYLIQNNESSYFYCPDKDDIDDIEENILFKEKCIIIDNYEDDNYSGSEYSDNDDNNEHQEKINEYCYNDDDY